MADTNPTIITAKLNDKELKDSIDKLVEYVGNKTTIMAGQFTKSMELMKDAMKDFAVTQKVSVDLIEQSWRQMSQSFDAMLRAQRAATGNGGNGGSGNSGNGAQPNTIKDLKEQISATEKIRDTYQQTSPALDAINSRLETMRNRLNELLAKGTIKEQMRNATKELGDANTMSSKTLSDAQHKLQALETIQRKYANTTMLSVQQQNRLATAIQNCRDKIDKLKTSQPKTLKQVMGMDENSVEAVARKMRELKKVTIDPNNAAQVKQLGDEYQRLKRLQAEMLGQNIQLTHSNNYLAQSFGYIRNRLVYALTLGAISNFVKNLYEVRAQYELLERSLGVLLGSFERGSQIFQELNQMALQSPFTLIELAGAAKQLTAYNFAAKEVVDTTRRLADLSAALGVPMERLTYNLGQIRAQTVLTARDARDFANAGLPIVSELSKRFTELEGRVVSTGDVYDRMKKKMVSYNDVMAVLTSITDEGGKFFNFQAKQAETLRVQMANLTLAINNMYNELGESNSSLLTLPIKALKALLQNWKSIDRVIKSVGLSLIAWKGIQMLAIRQQWEWAKYTGNTAKQMGSLGNAIKGVGNAIKAAFMNPWTWALAIISFAMDFLMQLKQARTEMHELNQEIKEAANEANDALLKFNNNKGNKMTAALAKKNQLSAQQGEKAWESIREQIELSAMSSETLIGKLLEIDDVNKRVSTGFDYTKSIQKATAALQDLADNQIKVSSDYGPWGLFSEGLVSDLKDYANELENFTGSYKELNDLLYTDKGMNTDMRIHFAEFNKEIGNTAESINNFIEAYGIKDPLQINEILERVRAQIKARNPEIRGEAAKIFDIALDQKMAELTNGAIDTNASLWKMFMDRLKNNSSSAFQDVNDDWIRKNQDLSKEQQKAVDDNLQYFKNSMPYAYNAVAQMVADASKLKIHIGITFGKENDTEFQKEVKRRVNALGQTIDLGGDAFLPTNNDDFMSWVSARQKGIKTLREENEKLAKDNTEWSKQQRASNNLQIEQQQTLLRLFNQSEKADSNSKGKGKGGRAKAEDIVAQTLKNEIQLIKDMQSNYDKLRKVGVSNIDAINLASQGYESTIISINAVLSKFGIKGFAPSKFAGGNVHALLDELTKQRQSLIASGKVKQTSLKDMDVEIQKLTIEAKTYDMKKVTDGLNSELSRLKDDYELAVELDANPELGDMFANMFGIDTTSISANVHEYIDALQQAANKSIRDVVSLNPQSIMQPFDLLRDDIETWAKNTGQDINGGLVAGLKAGQNEAKSVMEKYIVDLNKKTNDLEYKLADNNGKILIKEKERARLQEQLEKETDAMRRHYLELAIEEQGQAIDELKAQALALLPEYEAVFGGIAEHSAYMARKLQQDLMNIYKNAKYDGSKKEYTLTGKNGETVILSEERYTKEINRLNKEILKSEAPLKKIREAFKKNEDGTIDWVHALELVGDELGKLSQLANAVGDLAQILGFKDSAVDTINDVATTIEGVGKAAQGVAKIANGDVIGGATDVVGGVTGVIRGLTAGRTRRIDKEIKKSEDAVRSLNMAYKELERTVESSMGAEELRARRSEIANKKAELSELRRQMALEESKRSKDRDDDKIKDYQERIQDLQYEIEDLSNDIVNNLLGGSVKDAAEDFVNTWVSAWRSGEDTMESLNDKFDDMIDNMIAKSIASKLVSNRLKGIFDAVDEATGETSEGGAEITMNELNRLKALIGDKSIAEQINEDLTNLYGILGIAYGINNQASKNLSALQQGIQGITEDTAGALEAYMNIVSQRVFEQNEYLREIRDHVVLMNTDIQLGTFAQMLLQLQQSYTVQLAIQNILNGALTPSGHAFMVELNS